MRPPCRRTLTGSLGWERPNGRRPNGRFRGEVDDAIAGAMERSSFELAVILRLLEPTAREAYGDVVDYPTNERRRSAA